MIRFLLALLFLGQVAQAACTKITMPTDFAVVTNGTRANLKANFTEIETKVEPCMDSVDEIRGRFSGYAGSLLMSSLENLRLKLDSDASTTGLFLVENGSGDSLFRVKEDSTWRAFGAGTATKITASDSVVAAHLKTSGALIANGGSNASITGTSSELTVDVENSSSSGTARLKLQTASGSSGDAYIRMLEAGGVAYSLGYDKSALRFSIARSSSLGSSDVMMFANGGGVTFSEAVTTSSTLTADSLISSKVFESGSFTGTLTGVTGTVTGTIYYHRIFKQVTIMVPQLIGTSNTTACTITGMPSAIRPARRVGFDTNALMDNTSVSGAGLTGIYIQTDGTITLVWSGSTTGFTNSGTKGFLASIDQNTNTAPMPFTYTLQ